MTSSEARVVERLLQVLLNVTTDSDVEETALITHAGFLADQAHAVLDRVPEGLTWAAARKAVAP